MHLLTYSTQSLSIYINTCPRPLYHCLPHFYAGVDLVMFYLAGGDSKEFLERKSLLSRN